MQRHLRISLTLALIFASTFVLAQLTRPKISDDGTPRVAVQGQAAQPGARPTTGRRSAIVLLSEPSVTEYLMQSEPKAAALKSSVNQAAATPMVENPQHLRTRLFSDEGQTRLASIQRNKAPMIAQLTQRGIPVHDQTETVLNAIMIEATDEELAWLRQQSGVQSAEFSGFKRVKLDAATKLIGANTAWTQVGGQDAAGRGVKIAIVDSGIEISNPMFSDSGFSTPTGFPKTNNSTNGTYTNNKVIAAKNFVCPTTSGNCPNSTSNSSFDHSAADAFGHGTAVASVAAGRSVSTPIGTTMSGVAPGAYLGNYKVFDSTGSGADSAVLAAINAAVNDGFDIINFSGGGSCGVLPSQDGLYVTAINGAVNAGSVVVVAAGNEGPRGELNCALDGDNTITTPGELANAITAGASTNSHTLTEGLHVLSPAPVPTEISVVAFSPSDTPAFSSTVGPATAVDIVTLDSTRLGCTALAAGSLTGKIAFIKRGSCAFALKAVNAQNAGAIAVIFTDNQVEGLQSITTVGPPTPTIPSFIITQTDGASITAFLAAHVGQVQIRVDASISVTPQVADQVAEYSSRGPNPDFAIKPDLLAPGDLYAAAESQVASGVVYDPTGFQYNEGTSFATPMTSGSLAIVKQARPTLTPHDLKSALVNTATLVGGTQEGSLISVMKEGGGRINIPAALATTLVSDPVSLSFGLQVPGTLNLLQTMTLKNVGTTSETFTVSVSQTISDSQMTLGTSASSLTIGAGSTSSLNLTLVTAAAESGIFEGFVNLKSTTTATAIHIPYWVMFGTPVAAFGGLVDGAGFAKNVAPGGIVSLFGTNLGGTSGASATAVPLSNDLNHTSILINGRDNLAAANVTEYAPLFYTSGGQVNFQLPYTLTTGRTATLQPSVAGVLGNTITFTVSAAAPGIFVAGTTGVLVHGADSSLITAARPAAAGEVITIYCSGLGPVSGNYQTGFGGPAVPVATTTATPTVTIGGQPAAVQFSGLTPGLVGLYQVNVTVPTGLSPGSQQVTLSISGASGNTVTTFLK